MTDFICGKVTCPTVKDGVIVYVDPRHISKGFATTLSHEFDGLFRS